MRALIALLVMMPMTANAAELCRSYAANYQNEQDGSVFTISREGVLVENEDESEEATCVGNVCSHTYGSFIIEKEVPGQYVVINGRQMDAICDQ